MRISQIVSSIEEEASGPSYSVPRLASSLAALGHEVDLVSLGSPEKAHDKGYRDLRFGVSMPSVPGTKKLGLSFDMARQLKAGNYDIYHAQGIWMLPNAYPSKAARAVGAPSLISPRGMLSDVALSYSKWPKRVAWQLFQGEAIRKADCFHATSAQERDEIRRLAPAAPVAVIPNGIDIPEIVVGPGRTAPYLLSLGRVHPKKGLDRLIRAWAQVEAQHPEWRLRIVGPGEGGHEKELADLTAELGLSRVTIEGPVYGTEKQALMAGAGLFVLPTLSENFAMTVAESLAVSVPVISTKGAPWEGLERTGSGWWIDHGVEPLTAALDTALSLPADKREAMGRHGRDWMQAEFSWPSIAERMAAVYQWLLRGGSPPASVS